MAESTTETITKHTCNPDRPGFQRLRDREDQMREHLRRTGQHDEPCTCCGLFHGVALAAGEHCSWCRGHSWISGVRAAARDLLAAANDARDAHAELEENSRRDRAAGIDDETPEYCRLNNLSWEAIDARRAAAWRLVLALLPSPVRRWVEGS